MRNSSRFYKLVEERELILSYEYGHKPITRKALYKYKNKLKWDNIVCRQKLTEAMIEDFSKYMKWSDICRFQKLSESFIRKHMDEVEWEYVTQFQCLSDTFIREFQDYIDWRTISYCHNLDKDFVDEYHKKLDWTVIITERVHTIDRAWEEELKKRFNLKPIPTYSGVIWKEDELI